MVGVAVKLFGAEMSQFPAKSNGMDDQVKGKGGNWLALHVLGSVILALACNGPWARSRFKFGKW